MLSEHDIIQTLHSQFPEYIGDDAAVLPASEDKSLVISKDLLNEDVHFRLSYQSPESLAHKALHVNLSDIAAMGATPKYILLGLAIPSTFEDKLEAFLAAFSKACKKANVELIGGDTTRAETLSISITAIGEANPSHIKYRAGAKPGDLLCVTGELGLAHLGFKALEDGREGLESYKNAFLNPIARVEEGICLGKEPSIHAMMDVSDGLMLDLKRMCEVSDVGCEVNLDKLKHHEAALIGGEDYELMCAIAPDAYDKFSSKLKCIGKFQTIKNISYKKQGNPFLPNIKPFLHFGELPF